MIHEPAYLVYTKFLALLLNHYTTVFCMSSCDENVQLPRAFLNGLKTWKSHGDMQGVWHCPQYAIRRFLKSVGHKRGGHCRAVGRCFQCIYPLEVWSNTVWFSHLRTVMKALKFTSGDDVQETVTQWFTQPPMEFFVHEIRRLVHQLVLLYKRLLWLFVTQKLHPWAPSNGF
jgi:hypothetical protein